MGHEPENDTEWYHATKCLRPTQCSSQSFKRAMVQGRSMEELAEYMHNHLTLSSLHQINSPAARAMIEDEGIKYEMNLYSAAEVEEFEQAKSEKRARAKTFAREQKKRERESRDSKGATRPRDGDGDEYWEVTEADMQKMLEEMREQVASETCSEVARYDGGARSHLETKIEFRKEQVDAAVDCLDRAEKACEFAHDMMKAAADQFAHDAQQISDAKASITKAVQSASSASR